MAYTRVSARRGEQVALEARFVQGGVPTAPHAIYRVEIYRGKVAAENIVDAIDIPSPDSSEYPGVLVEGAAGLYTLNWTVPDYADVPDVYFDVWYFFGSDPRNLSSSSGDEYVENEDKLIQFCNRFWVYPDSWYVDGGLQTLRFGFEALDTRFNKPEKRPLEIGLMPLPLYDYDYNLVAPIIPYIDAKIDMWTVHKEPIITQEPMTIKLRQGAYRSNPFVLSYLFDTEDIFIGTYKYRITLTLPDGTTRISPDSFITVS
jgi:hypothetical protein